MRSPLIPVALILIVHSGTAFVVSGFIRSLARPVCVKARVVQHMAQSAVAHVNGNLALTTIQMIAHSALPTAPVVVEKSRENLLTSEEEVVLARCMQQWRVYMEKAEEMKNQIQRSPTANEWTIAMSTKSSYLNGLLSIANAAKKAMIDHNMRLVVHIARYYRYRGLTFTDLVQEGSFGLVKAVEKYDAERGFRFSTYASWWIKQAMSRACAEKGRVVRLPAHIHDLAVSVKRIEQDFKLKHHGSIPTSNQIAELLGLPAKKIALLRTQVKEVTSLDEPLYPHSNSKGNVLTKKDRLQDTTLNPSEKADVAVAAEQLCGILEQLNLREAEVLRLRFGLQSIHALTLDEIGQKYSVTRERVRQIEARALSKMRVPTRAEQVEIMFRARRGHTRTFKRT